METDGTWLSKPGLWQQHLVVGEAPALALCGAGYMGYAATGMHRRTDRLTPWETNEQKRRCALCASMMGANT
jgi:hypothetical protein